MADHICARAAMLEQGLWENELPAAARAEIEAHAAECAECAQVLAGIKAARAGMAELRDEDIAVPPADAAWTQVAGRLEAKPQSWLRQQAPKLVAALALVVGVGIYISQGDRGGAVFGPSVRNMFANAVSTDAVNDNRAAICSTIYRGDGGYAAAPSAPSASAEGMVVASAQHAQRQQVERYRPAGAAPSAPAATEGKREEADVYYDESHNGGRMADGVRYVTGTGMMEAMVDSIPAAPLVVASARMAPAAATPARPAPAASTSPRPLTNRDVRPYRPEHIDRPPVEPEVQEPVTREPDDELIPLSQQRLEYAASMTMRVDDARAAHKRVTGLVAEAGGQLINSRVSQGEEAGATATLKVRVPSAKFDGFITSLHELGEVLAEDITAQDRTRQVQAVAQQLGQNEQTAATVKQRLAEVQGRSNTQRLERQLARLNSERVQLQQTQQTLTQRVDYATLAITLREDEDRPASPGVTSGFSGEMRYALNRALNLCSEGFGIILIGLGFCLPWALLGWILWWLYRRYRNSW